MSMTKKERHDWLYQISRIHEEEKRQRSVESEMEIEKILRARDEEE